ncbi:MAG: 50S ribosomal protein L33 [Clostridiales bacterium]|jgi:large subunit ribosomal protein L33|nr:50S ribosomal protein L33 [Clostridiales bacterium]
MADAIKLQCTNEGCAHFKYTFKNKKNTPDRMELKIFCPNCNAHTLHKETK